MEEGVEAVREKGFAAPPTRAAQLVGFAGGLALGVASAGAISLVDTARADASLTEPKTKSPILRSIPILAISSSSTPAAKTTFFPLAFPLPLGICFFGVSLPAICSVLTEFGMAPLNREL